MKLIQNIISGFKIDWSNHIIAFLATIIGIFIAFQLQDWSDARKEKEKIELAIKSLKNEIIENRGLLKAGLDQFKFFNGYTDFIVGHYKTDSSIVCTQSEWDSVKIKYNRIFNDKQIIRRLNNDQVETKFDIFIDFFPPRIHTDSWEALKSSGILTAIPLEKLVTFTTLYGELNRNWTKTTPEDFLFYAKPETFNIKEFNKLTNSIEFEYKIKLDRIEDLYEKIMQY